MNGKSCGTPAIACGIEVTTPEDAVAMGIVITPPEKVSKDWTTQYEYDLVLQCELRTAGEYELEYRMPAGYYDAPPTEATKVKVTIIEPDEKERQVYDWLQQCYLNLKSVSLGACYKDLLTNYPNSIYTAWIVFPYLAEPEHYKPEIAKELIDNYQYPSANSVPYEDFGFHDIGDGEPMAQYQLKWAEKILIDHPDFQYRERLQLVIALNKIVLKEKDGFDLLRNISLNDTEIGLWSKDFLALY